VVFEILLAVPAVLSSNGALVPVGSRKWTPTRPRTFSASSSAVAAGRSTWIVYSGSGRRAAPAEEAEAEVTIPFTTAALGGTVALQLDGRELSVKVPAGVEEGQALRLHGQAPGGGDLRLRLHIQPHPFFRREGKDIVLEVPLSVAEAVLGTTVEVPTLDGARLSVKVPPGTSSGTRLRLRGRGIAGGDQYIETKIVVPAAKDERSRELVEEFARLNPQNPRAGLW
jgi:curved DNA-binding protein